MFRINNLKCKLILSFFALLYAGILFLLPISCPILSTTGIPCLGCGMTRALLAALRFDFAHAFSHHMMFWSVPILYFCFLFDGKIFKKYIYNVIIYGILFLGFIINWMVHMFGK